MLGPGKMATASSALEPEVGGEAALGVIPRSSQNEPQSGIFNQGDCKNLVCFEGRIPSTDTFSRVIVICLCWENSRFTTLMISTCLYCSTRG